MNFEAFDRPADLVEGNLGAMNSRADEALTKAYEAINSLGGIPLELPPGPALPDLPDVNVPSPTDLTPPSKDGFGSVGGFSNPTFEDLSQFLGINLSDLDITVPEFESSVGAFILPARPAPIDTFSSFAHENRLLHQQPETGRSRTLRPPTIPTNFSSDRARAI